ncbi:MFS transporter [Acrocarpospora phusangensis]|uniref:MFS transporter n=1 Tax=Acrocarpospora phusangensis TaxID=1070424 RepID=A0A919Q9H2_9ACTN|nr:MFS transporter [Acrocarpospora phusangensis]GIH24989.1 MFS transporter [Acrocarpospora phusangensis]
MGHGLRTARIGTTLTFVLAGIFSGTVAVRMPALAGKLDLSEGRLGMALLACGVGALVSMQAARPLMRRLGSKGILTATGPSCGAALALVGVAPSYPMLLAAMSVFGVAFGLLDVAMNAQGSAVEARYGRPLLSGMHAGWCFGAIVSGLAGFAAIRLGLTFTPHLAGVGVAGIPAALALVPTFLADPPAREDRTGSRRGLPRVVYLLGIVVFAAFTVEGMVADWNGLYLRDILGAPESVAALGYPLFVTGMLLGRLAGDRLRARFGVRAHLTVSGLATAAAFTVVVTAPAAGLVMPVLLVAGLAIAPVIPFALSLAGGADPAQSGPAIAQTAAIGYAGLLLGPVIIGFLADATSLRVAMAVGLVLGAVIAGVSRSLPRDTPARAVRAVVRQSAAGR